MDIKNLNFCIVGLGLLGGSYAKALTKGGATVTAVDISEGTIKYATDNNIITSGKTHDFDDLLHNADAVVLALYPSDIVNWTRQNADKFKQNAYITDVCGVKTHIVDEIQSALRKDVEFISAHPMAGREVGGVKNADDSMFKRANYIVVPTEKNTESGIDFAVSLGEFLQFKRISFLSCEEHDKMIAYLSQLTHAIAVSLMNANDSDEIARYTGDSFRDLTRIAKINENMWTELFMANRDFLLSEIDAFTASLESLRRALESGDEDTMKQLFVSSTKRREFFDKLEK